MEELLHAANEFLRSVGNLSTIPKENIQFTVPEEGFRYINPDKPNLADAITKFTKDVKKLYEMIRMNMELINIHAGSAPSEETAHPTVFLHLSALSAVLIQLGCWLRRWYTVE